MGCTAGSPQVEGRNQYGPSGRPADEESATLSTGCLARSVCDIGNPASTSDYQPPLPKPGRCGLWDGSPGDDPEPLDVAPALGSDQRLGRPDRAGGATEHPGGPKFNDDRLGRTLDALYPHLDVIWQEIVAIALVKARIDLSVLFYDLTGIVGHGRYEGSELMDFGFAHNTPSNKRKLKLGADVSADGNIPVAYAPWSGRTADQATVMSNMEKLARWLNHHGHADQANLIVGDRAMLNAEIAIAYDKHGLRQAPQPGTRGCGRG